MGKDAHGPPRTAALFDPRKYLNEYFLDVNEEYEALYRFYCGAVRDCARGGRALELGVGPTVYSSIPLAERFREIHLADYMQANLVEIRKWLENRPDCFDWSLHVKLVLQCEGQSGTENQVAEREARLRASITKVGRCDLRLPAPLGTTVEPYDLVTAHYCTEAAASTADEWQEVVGNIVPLIIPGGALLLSAAAACTVQRTYRSDEPARVVCSVTSEMARQCLEDVGLQPVREDFVPAPPGRPYAGSILLFARKALDK